VSRRHSPPSEGALALDKPRPLGASSAARTGAPWQTVAQLLSVCVWVRLLLRLGLQAECFASAEAYLSQAAGSTVGGELAGVRSRGGR
jgi:hypothetical protein